MALTQVIGSGIGQVTDIKLGGSGSANTLDDYEEGTWTPEVADAGTGGNTGTYTSGYSHRYIKIGRLVMVTFSLFNINTSGMTGANTLYIRGLPFGGFSSEQYFTNHIHFDVINTTNTGATISGEITSIGIFMDVNPKFRIFQYYDRGLASVKVQDLGTGTADILGNLTYYTS
jgi:hypothetical protein